MGDYRITIDAVGGHGCQRGVKDGETVAADCGSPSCPDCRARRFVRELMDSGNSVNKATLEHWPDPMLSGYGATAGQLVPRSDSAGPVDDLLTGKRTGSF